MLTVNNLFPLQRRHTSTRRTSSSAASTWAPSAGLWWRTAACSAPRASWRGATGTGLPPASSRRVSCRTLESHREAQVAFRFVSMCFVLLHCKWSSSLVQLLYVNAEYTCLSSADGPPLRPSRSHSLEFSTCRHGTSGETAAWGAGGVASGITLRQITGGRKLHKVIELKTQIRRPDSCLGRRWLTYCGTWEIT